MRVVIGGGRGMEGEKKEKTKRKKNVSGKKAAFSRETARRERAIGR